MPGEVTAISQAVNVGQQGDPPVVAVTYGARKDQMGFFVYNNGPTGGFFDLPAKATAIALSPDARYAYIALTPSSVRNRGQSGPNPHQLAMYDLSNTDHSKPQKIFDLDIEKVPVAIAVSPNGQKVYVVNSQGSRYESDILSILDVTNKADPRMMPGVSLMRDSNSVGVTQDSSTVYVSNARLNRFNPLRVLIDKGGLQPIDATNNRKKDYIELSGSPQGLAVGGQFTYVIQQWVGVPGLTTLQSSDGNYLRNNDLPTIPAAISLATSSNNVVSILQDPWIGSKSIALYNPVTVLPIAPPIHLEGAIGAALAPDGKALYAAAGKTLYSWIIDLPS
jgi:DNA-binding beta-propeller fold protein YncE